MTSLAGVAALAAFLVGGVLAAAVIDAAAAARFAGIRVLPEVRRTGRRTALLLVQQRTTTERVDAQSWDLAPALLVAVAAAAAATVPIGRGVAAADVPDGIVAFGAAMALVMVAVFLHGWSSNSLFPLFGAYRFVAQALSYEMPLALVLIGAALPAESLSVGDIVVSQSETWNVIRQPLGLPLFLVAVAGLAFWGPLSLPDAADLGGGTASETSGRALLAWRVARLAVLFAGSSMGAAAFLGGWLGPVLPGPLWMILKTTAVMAVVIVVGYRVPRLRLERFVVVAWTVLIPLALVDVFAAGIVAL